MIMQEKNSITSGSLPDLEVSQQDVEICPVPVSQQVGSFVRIASVRQHVQAGRDPEAEK